MYIYIYIYMYMDIYIYIFFKEVILHSPRNDVRDQHARLHGHSAQHAELEASSPVSWPR